MGTHPIFESDFDCLTERSMSDISNTNGAGDAENVAKDKIEIKKLVQQLDEINVSGGGADIDRNIEKQRPTVVTRGIEGRVKWFNIPRGYGFIERLDEQPDVFVHQSAVVRPGRKPRFSLFLKGGEQVEFDVVEGLKGLEAAAVTAPGGYELPTIAMKGGNHHHRDFKHRNRNFRRRDRRHNNGNESSENEKNEGGDNETKMRSNRHNRNRNKKQEVSIEEIESTDPIDPPFLA